MDTPLTHPTPQTASFSNLAKKGDEHASSSTLAINKIGNKGVSKRGCPSKLLINEPIFDPLDDGKGDESEFELELASGD